MEDTRRTQGPDTSQTTGATQPTVAQKTVESAQGDGGTSLRDRVLVGIDGSTNSARAFDIALAIAKRRGWSLRLVSSYTVPPLDPESGPVITANFTAVLQENARKALDECAEAARAEGVPVTTKVAVGHAVEVLVEESAQAGLAVVGKRGRNRFAGRFLGSVSAALAAHGHCPTLVIPEKWETPDPSKLVAPGLDQPGGDDAEREPTELLTEATPPRPERAAFENVDDAMNFRQEIVVGVDLGDGARRIAETGAGLAELFGRRLTLVTAVPLNVDVWYPHPIDFSTEFPSIRSRVTEHLTDLVAVVKKRHPDLEVHWQFFDGSPAGVLSEASRSASAVVLGTHGHGGFAGLLLGSVSQAVLNRSAAPVLVVPTPENAR